MHIVVDGAQDRPLMYPFVCPGDGTVCLVQVDPPSGVSITKPYECATQNRVVAQLIPSKPKLRVSELFSELGSEDQVVPPFAV
jgi:hypothetical protein